MFLYDENPAIDIEVQNLVEIIQHQDYVGGKLKLVMLYAGRHLSVRNDIYLAWADKNHVLSTESLCYTGWHGES